MAIAQQQHGFVLELLGRDGFFLGQHMLYGQSGHEWLVVQSRSGQSCIGKRLRQDGAINFTIAQHFHELDSEIFLQHQRHLRRLLHDLTHQVGQQIRANGVDHAQPKSACKGVFAAFGNFFYFCSLLQHKLGMANDFFTQRCGADIVGTALEQLHVQLFFKLFDGHRQSGLRHKASLGRLAEVPFTRYRHNVFQLSQGHANVSSFQKL